MAYITCTVCGTADPVGYTKGPQTPGPVCRRCYAREYAQKRGAQPRIMKPADEPCAACGHPASRRGPVSQRWLCSRCHYYEHTGQPIPARQPDPCAECGAPARSRISGQPLCNTHYQRWYYHQCNPNAPTKPRLNGALCPCGKPAERRSQQTRQPLCMNCYQKEAYRMKHPKIQQSVGPGGPEHPKRIYTKVKGEACARCKKRAATRGASGRPLCAACHQTWMHHQKHPDATYRRPMAHRARTTAPAPKTTIAPVIATQSSAAGPRLQHEVDWREAKALLETEPQSCYCGRSYAGEFYAKHIETCDVYQSVTQDQERAA